MKYYNKYNTFIEKSDSLKLNEGLIDKVKDFFNIDKIKSFVNFDFSSLLSFFKTKFGKEGWLYNLFFLQSVGYLKSIGVTVFDEEYKKGLTDISNIEYKSMFENTDIDFNDDFSLIETVSLNEDLKHPDSEILNLKPDEVTAKIKLHYIAQVENDIHLPLFIWGAPGIGKTDVVHQAAKELNLTAIVIDLSLKDPVDFIGIPMPEQHFKTDEDGKRIPTLDKQGNPVYKTTYAVPKIFPEPGEYLRGGIIFFDEMNRANQSVLNASLQFVCNRHLNGYVLPDDWIIIAASNRPNIDDVGMTEVGKALGNRFAQINMYVRVQDWIKWATSDKAMTKSKTNDPKFVPEYYISPELLSFLTFNEEMFHKTSSRDTDTSVFPTPRSWSRASKLMHLVKKRNGGNISKKEMKDIFAPEVGYRAASLFIAFVDLIKAISPTELEMIYTNPDKAPILDDKLAVDLKDKAEKLEVKDPDFKDLFAGDSFKPDIIKGLLTYAVYLRRGKPSTLKDIQNAIKYAMRLKSFEYASLFAKDIFALDADFLKKYPTEAEDLIIKLTTHFGKELGMDEE